MAHITCNFLSYTLHRAVDISVVIPTMCFGEMMGKDPHHAQDAAFPVLYLLHGYGNNHATWNGYTSLELYAEERNIAVVMLSAENKAYINHGGDDNYYDFIQNELPELVRGMFPVSRRAEDTYIAGLSMGGYGALVHGLSNSEKYAAIGAFSAGVMRSKRKTKPEFDLYALAEKHAACATPLYIACGDKDFLYADNCAYKDKLVSLGYHVHWTVGEGFDHEWRYWNQQAEAFMDWLPRTDRYSGQKRRI